MNILIIHQAYYPEMSGTARRAKELAESFARDGHIINVLTSTPRIYRSFPEYKYKLFEEYNGVFIHRVKTLIEVNKNVFLRIISYFLFCIQSLHIAIKLSKKSDIIISIAPLSSGIIGALAMRFKKTHHHFDVPDMLPDLGIAAGMLKNKYLIKFLYIVEKWVYNNSNTISGCTHGHVEAIKSKGINKQIFWIPDWIDDSFFKINLIKFYYEVSKLYSFPGKKIISFVGNIGALQKPDTFVEMMELFEKGGLDEFVFLFIGDGIMLPQLKKMVELKKLKNIKFIGRVKREHIPAIMRKSDVLVTNYVAEKHLNLYIPGKLFEYAISKKPIVIGAKGDAKVLIDKYRLGLAVEPSSKEKFKEAIIKVSKNDYDYNPKTEQFTNDYSMGKVTTLYNQIFNQLNQ